MLKVLFWFHDELYSFVQSRSGYPDIEQVVEWYTNPGARISGFSHDWKGRNILPSEVAILRSVPDDEGPTVG
jgi:hypothetical protein